MIIALGIFFILHGFAHVVGFAASFKLLKNENAPYSTRILNGAIDVGDVGTRVLGLLWLIAAVAFAVVGVSSFFDVDWWTTASYSVVGFSTLMCIVGLPLSKIGLVIDIILIAAMLVGEAVDLLP